MENTSDKIWLVGFRIDPNYIQADFYTILLESRDDQPISHQEQIILFSDSKYAQIALEFDSHYSELTTQIAPQDIYCILDFAQMFYLMTYENNDESGCIVNCLNVLFDMLKCASIEIPKPYKDILFKIADHLTFEKELYQYLNCNEITRNQVVIATQWALGAVISRATFIPKEM